MQIVCSTDEAAIQVLRLLLAARLLPRRDYEIYPSLSSMLPITFTVVVAMPDEKLAQIHAVDDTSIVP